MTVCPYFKPCVCVCVLHGRCVSEWSLRERRSLNRISVSGGWVYQNSALMNMKPWPIRAQRTVNVDQSQHRECWPIRMQRKRNNDHWLTCFSEKVEVRSLFCCVPAGHWCQQECHEHDGCQNRDSHEEGGADVVGAARTATAHSCIDQWEESKGVCVEEKKDWQVYRLLRELAQNNTRCISVLYTHVHALISRLCSI